MKKKWIAVFFAAALLLLAACGSSASSASTAPRAAEAKEVADYAVSTAYDAGSAAYDEYEYDMVAEEAAEAPMMTPSPANGSGARPYNGDVKLIYRADLSAQTSDLTKAAEQIEVLTQSVGGYIESSDISNYNYNSGLRRYAYYTVRVPGEKYEQFLESLNNSDACTVTNLSKSTTDVGADYADNEARLETYRIKQERLQELLKKAENMEDIITIENALTDVEYEIEYYSSNLKRYDALISFSTITINLEEVDREAKTAGDRSLGERIATSFSNGISAFVSGCENFVIAIAGAIIPLLILAAVIVVIVIVIRTIAKKKRQKKEEKEEK